jgi:hypothetical protein
MSCEGPCGRTVSQAVHLSVGKSNGLSCSLQDSTRRGGRRKTERGLHAVLIDGQFVSAFYYRSYLVRPISQAFGAQ